MNQLDTEQEQRIKTLLRESFSGIEPDDTEIYADIQMQCIELRDTAKLGRPDPFTPPILPSLSVETVETVQIPITRISDFAQGELNCRQSIYDVSGVVVFHGIDFLWSIIARHQRIHGRIPAYIYVSRELLSPILEDIEAFYRGAFQDEIPFPNEYGQSVRIRVAADDRLQTFVVRCRERAL